MRKRLRADSDIRRRVTPASANKPLRRRNSLVHLVGGRENAKVAGPRSTTRAVPVPFADRERLPSQRRLGRDIPRPALLAAS